MKGLMEKKNIQEKVAIRLLPIFILTYLLILTQWQRMALIIRFDSNDTKRQIVASSN